MELQRLFQVSIVIRVGLILYGEVQDRLLNVKFTDIDYRVFSDASSNVLNGRSPFDRHTYRYTPIIAWLLTPNHILFQSFGKLLFATLDIIVGVVICKILQAQNVCIRDQVIACGVWLLNPLTVVVSCRGNAESIMALLLLLSLYCIMKGRRVVWGGVLYGTAVHVKLYPIVYALPLTLYLGPSPWAGDHWYKPQWGRLVTKHRVQFIIASGVTFVLLTSLCYCVYGWEYVYEAILYHVGRTDVRHNFSIYFYPLYLTHGTWVCTCIGLAAFVPQMLLVFVIGCKYYRNLPLCVFAQTFAFVTFNKVCTSQVSNGVINLDSNMLFAYLYTWFVIF